MSQAAKNDAARWWQPEESANSVEEPLPFADHLGPAGQVNRLVSPLDALRPAWSDHGRVAGSAAESRGGHERGTRPGARRHRRTDPALPDENSDQVRPFHEGELDVGAVGK